MEGVYPQGGKAHAMNNPSRRFLTLEAGAVWLLTSLTATACGARSNPVARESATTTSVAPPGPSSSAFAEAPEAGASPEVDAPVSPSFRPGAYAWKGPPVSDGGPPEALSDCEGDLGRAGVTFRAAALPVHREKGTVCGAPQVVTYVKGPSGIVYDPPPLLSCPMALALASFEKVLQEEAQRDFQSEVARVQQLGTYNCRVIAAFRGTASEHSYANAIDLAEFTLKSGRKISVLKDFFTGEGDPPRPGGAFLRAVAHRGFDEDIFSNVLTPFWDAAHKNHLHVDLARYRVNGFHPHA
jgi:hypothetical protein